VEEVLLTMVKKTMDQHVFVESCIYSKIVSTSFDLWMFYDNVDTFALLINFINSHLGPHAYRYGVV
jgi:hypothetical protein